MWDMTFQWGHRPPMTPWIYPLVNVDTLLWDIAILFKGNPYQRVFPAGHVWYLLVNQHKYGRNCHRKFMNPMKIGDFPLLCKRLREGNHILVQQRRRHHPRPFQIFQTATPWPSQPNQSRRWPFFWVGAMEHHQNEPFKGRMGQSSRPWTAWRPQIDWSCGSAITPSKCMYIYIYIS